MSLQERTLVVKNFDADKTTHKLLKELCLQGGPVRKVVVKPDHAFVEYEDVESVGYSKALLDGVELFGRKLIMEPKSREASFFKYTRILHDYVQYDKQQQQALQHQQHMMNLYHQQAQLGTQYYVQPNQNLHTSVGLIPNFDPHILQNFSTPQHQYVCPDVPSGSVPRYNNNSQFRRSRSFHNHNERGRSSQSSRNNDRRK